MSSSEEVHMNKWWVQTLITIGAMLVCISIAWATCSTKLTVLEKRVDQGQGDHDVLISLNTKMDLLMKDVGELKHDLKKHVESQGK
jgi:hypothetical protein